MLVVLAPFWILVMTSFKSGPDVLTTPAFQPPKHPTLDNFRTLLSPSSTASGSIFHGLENSAIITVGSIVGLVCFGSVTAYALVRGKSRWTTRSYFLFLVAIILPTQLGVLPLYVEARNLGLVGLADRHDHHLHRRAAAALGVPVRRVLPHPATGVRGGRRRSTAPRASRPSCASCSR